jgi:hypothetical protein
VSWADETIGRDRGAPAAFVEIATTPAADITALRHALLQLCEDRPSETVLRALFHLVWRDFSSGRRNLSDTMTVLRQIRGLLGLPPELNDRVRALGVDFFFASRGGDTAAFERRLHDWLAQYAFPEEALLP